MLPLNFNRSNIVAMEHNLYVLDTEEDNVIGCAEHEQEAIDICNAKELKGHCYYKPKLIDAMDGTPITRKNINLYYK